MSKASRKSGLVSVPAFLHSKRYFLLCGTILCVVFFFFFIALNVELLISVMLISLIALFIAGDLGLEYHRRARFYKDLLDNIARLDKSYLVLETLEKPQFYDGMIMYEAMYDVNKSMCENVSLYKRQAKEFKEYIEAWVHEAKTPLAALSLLVTDDPRILTEIDRLSRDVEQVLYFARAENAEDDYVIKTVSLRKVIDESLQANREIINLLGVDIGVDIPDISVHTDSKWLRFIVQQILANSLKYEASKIVFAAASEKHGSETLVKLKIRDNGIGISEKDLPRVFNKSFTGKNGHNNNVNSTGMGLYIAKTLCDKLGHQISISSKEEHFTEVEIVFYESSYFNVTKK